MIPTNEALLVLAAQVLLVVVLFEWMKYTFMILAGLLIEEQPLGWVQSIETGFRLFPTALVFGGFAVVMLEIIQPLQAVIE